MTVTLSPTLAATVAADPSTVALMATVGELIAADARRDAPKATGAGAASIAAETGVDLAGAYTRISWDREHYYMLFSEVGNSRQSARPFLRPALAQRRTL